MAATKTDLRTIAMAARKRRMIRFQYTKKTTGETLSYECEPYEIKEGFLWAYHPIHHAIHKFYLDRILPGSVKMSPKRFTPRWPVKF